MPAPYPTVVLGGGIAGLAAAWALARRGDRVELVEREATLGAHSTGRSAAIFRCLDLSPGAAALALRNGQLLDHLLGGRQRWLQSIGVIYASAGRPALAALAALARSHGLAHAWLGKAELHRLVPCLGGGATTEGLFLPGEGVLDPHAIQQAVLDALRTLGVRVRTASPARQVWRAGGAVHGVELMNGELIRASAVVIAAGAWAAEVGRSAGAPLPLRPLRRHLALLAPDRPLIGPVIWRVDEEVYFRAESGGVLACPCDETPSAPGVPQTDPEALAVLGGKLQRTAPGLADAGVRGGWAGLRTFADDRMPVVGPDPRIRGLFWLAGLGGHGMSIGLAAGELLADVVHGRSHPLGHLLSPQRLCA